jgi:hypothetical protein
LVDTVIPSVSLLEEVKQRKATEIGVGIEQLNTKKGRTFEGLSKHAVNPAQRAN